MKKDEDISIWEFTEQLFDNIDPPAIDKIYQAWGTDGYILESMMWENYLDYADDIERVAQAADSFSHSSCYHNTIYTGGEYESDFHCGLGLVKNIIFVVTIESLINVN